MTTQAETAEDPVAAGVAVMHLGVSAPLSYDEETCEIISSAFYDEDEPVRDLALWASTYCPYRECLPDLHELAMNDRSSKIRERARLVVKVFAAMGVEDS